MDKRHTFKKTAALVLALGLTLGATGCEFIVTDNILDLQQVVATVDISDVLKDDTAYGEAVAQKVDELIANGALSTDIPKRDLVAYFMNYGYSFIQQGYSYKDTFNYLMDGLSNNKVLTQYAVAYYIQKGINKPSLVAKPFDDYKAEQLAAVSEAEADLLEKHPEVLTMKYYLTDFGNTSADSMKWYYEAEYSLKKSMNNSLDKAEAEYIKQSGSGHTHEDTRTTPTGAKTEKEDYMPMKNGVLDYDVYTGRNNLVSCGAYEKVTGSTKSSRMDAYNAFLSNLQSYGLVEKGENTAHITLLNYYYTELSSTLGQALVNKYYEELQDNALANLTADKVLDEYNALKENQQLSYDADYTAFEKALEGVSDEAFLLYGLKDYGFVYNILIPFSKSQSQAYSAEKKKSEGEDLFNARKEILEKVQAKDLRSAWFCTEDAENYSYAVTEGYYDNGATKGEKTYLFFEENFKDTDKYQSLKQYAGQYPYNGVAELKNGEWEFTPNKLNVTGNTNSFIQEFENYVSTYASVDVDGDWCDGYGKNYYVLDENDKPTATVDYSAFMYYTGSFEIENTDPAAYFDKTCDAYKATAAVNELMFAYSTDTGCLNTYMGYVVSPYKTNFVSEFEYAAQYVVKQGVGAYAVAPSDYGWHIIYCAYKFDGGEVYGKDNNDTDGYNHAAATGDAKVEGSFSNLFYEALKATSAETQANSVQAKVLKDYKDSITLHVKRYQDLLDIE